MLNCCMHSEGKVQGALSMYGYEVVSLRNDGLSMHVTESSTQEDY